MSEKDWQVETVRITKCPHCHSLLDVEMQKECQYDKCEHKDIDFQEDSFVRYIDSYESDYDGDLVQEEKYYHLDCYLKKTIENIPESMTKEQILKTLKQWSERP